jgi:hypothetical protein
MPGSRDTEAAAFKGHLEYALYPEMARDTEAVQRSVDAMAAGLPDETITFGRRSRGW